MLQDVQGWAAQLETGTGKVPTRGTPDARQHWSHCRGIEDLYTRQLWFVASTLFCIAYVTKKHLIIN